MNQLLDGGVAIDGGVTVAKMVHTLPSRWADCVAHGRIKFEKYFNHKVCGLIVDKKVKVEGKCKGHII